MNRFLCFSLPETKKETRTTTSKRQRQVQKTVNWEAAGAGRGGGKGRGIEELWKVGPHKKCTTLANSTRNFTPPLTHLADISDRWTMSWMSAGHWHGNGILRGVGRKRGSRRYLLLGLVIETTVDYAQHPFDWNLCSSQAFASDSRERKHKKDKERERERRKKNFIMKCCKTVSVGTL